MSGKTYIERREHKKKRFYRGFRLYYHFTWATKHRTPMMVGPVQGDIQRLLIHQCRRLEYVLLEMAVMPEHVHLLLSLKPTDFLPDVVKHLRGGVARAFNAAHEEGPIDWNSGYGVDTVGKIGLQRVRLYIVRQREALRVQGLEWYLQARHLERELRQEK